MAYDIQIAGNYSGRPNHSLQLYVRREQVSGNSSRYAWELYATRNSGSVSYGLDCKPWSVAINGQGWSGCSALDFRSTNRITLASGYTNWFGHDGNGNLGFWVDAWHNTAPQVIGNADPPAAVFYVDRIPQAPGAPVQNQPTNITTTTMNVTFNGTTDGGGGISGWQLQYSAHSQFADGGLVIASNGNSNVTGLTPGTTYYFRSRGYNPYGYSPWSNTVSATTLPATPPGMTITTSPSGLSATVSLTPPGGVSGVSQYNVERRLTGTTTVTTEVTTTTSLTVTGLVPGASYDWRSSAVIGGYTSPWTAWVPALQPNPSTSPGDYFDGATAATADQSYAWTGTAQLSTSTATGVGVAGWLSFAQGNPTSGATGAVARVTSDLFGPHAARVTFFTDQTVAGFVGGSGRDDPGRTDVTPGAQYVGSIHVNPSKANRMRARLVWYKLAGTEISNTVGADVLVPAGQWTRLQVTATAPPEAEWAAVHWQDAAGSGWSFWLAGDSVLMDGAMISLGTEFPYFDGSFTDGDGFNYSWTGTANASPSIRQDVPANTADNLLDPDCLPVPAPPRPPIVLDECIEDVGVWRRYTVVIPATEVSDWLDVLPTFILTTFGVAERQVRIRVYANPFNYPISQVDTTTWCAEQIISYLPPNTVMTLDAELQRVFASVAGGPDQAADHLLYGTGGTPANWPILTCGMSYLVSFDTPLEAAAGNTRVDVELTPEIVLMVRGLYGGDCVDLHSVYITDRGGQRRVGELVDLSQVRWNRVRDEVSEASILVSGGACSAQAELLRGIEPKRNEMVIYRGTTRVWEGPVNLVGWHSDSVEIVAHDVLDYVYGRPLSVEWNNNYPNVTEVTTRMETILSYELANAFSYPAADGVTPVSVPAWEAIDPPANVLPYLVVHHHPNEARTSAKTTPFQMTVGEHLDNFARNGGIDYTVVGRAIHIWDVSRNLGQIKTLTEADFFGEIIVTAYGSDLASVGFAVAQDGRYGGAGVNSGYYGPWTKIFTVFDEDETNPPTQADLNGQAQRNLSGRSPVPVEVRVPDNSGIRLSPGLSIDDLVPGVHIPLLATLNSRVLSQMQKLHRVQVQETSAGETIAVTLLPATKEDADVEEP